MPLDVLTKCIRKVIRDEDIEIGSMRQHREGLQTDRGRSGEKAYYGHGHYKGSGNFCKKGSSPGGSRGGDCERI